MHLPALLAALATAGLGALVFGVAHPWLKRRHPEQADARGAAMDLAEFVVVSLLMAGVLILGGSTLVDPSRWLEAGGVGVQAVVGAALGYYAGHLAALIVLGGPRSLKVHHLVLLLGFSGILLEGRFHGYALITLVGTSTSALRNLSGLSRRGLLRVDRRWTTGLYLVLEGIPALVIPVRFALFDFATVYGESPAMAVVGAIAIPVITLIAWHAMARVACKLPTIFRVDRVRTLRTTR